MLKFMIITLCLFLISTVAQADFVLKPSSFSPGGVGTLCWQGKDQPPRLLQATFAAISLPIFQSDGNPCVLVGVDLDHSPGLWPLTIDTIDSDGKRHRSHLSLEVVVVDRPTQKLSLPKQMVTPTKKVIIKQIEDDNKRLGKIFKLRQPVIFNFPFRLPLKGEIISTFGLRRVLNGISKSAHNGIDFRASKGTPVSSLNNGTVVLADDLYYTGKTVILDHGGGLFSLYAHLDSLAVTEGTQVATGQVVGSVGSTGRSTGPHLHIGTRLGQTRIDPLALINLFSHEKR